MLYRKTVLLIPLIAVMLFSCVTPMGMTSASTPVQGKKLEVLGKSEGSDSAWAVLGIWTIGRPDIDAAVREAIDKKNGDAMINVRWYEKTLYMVLVSRKTVYVTGEVVRFVKEDDKEKRKGGGR